jgi:hypothetical protein
VELVEIEDAMEQIGFDPADPKAALSQLPHAAAVFALYGADAHAEPYIGRTPNLRARLERLLQPSPKHPRRLQLAGRVRRIAWRLTGSEFESLLTQFSLLEEIYGPKALERMHLRAPAFVRYLGGNPYPRIVVTNRPSLREADWAYGPFPSRAAAERYAEEALKLFLLRRCIDDLNPDPRRARAGMPARGWAASWELRLRMSWRVSACAALWKSFQIWTDGWRFSPAALTMRSGTSGRPLLTTDGLPGRLWAAC